MTSRTPLGAQPPRHPSRTLSSSSLPGQRPSHHRTLSQQYLPPSPVRKESYLDSTFEPGDASQSRYGTALRRGGSRLKLELSTDAIMADAATCESPQALSVSRITPMNEVANFVQPSPGESIRPGPSEIDNEPLPLPPQPRFSHALPKPPPKPAPPVSSLRKDNRPKPYTIEYPQDAPRYKLGNVDKTRTAAEPPRVANSGYADFFPWDGTHPEDQFSETVIRNGYFHKAPAGNGEAGSAKPTLFPLLKQKNCLNALSSVFLGVSAQRRHSGQITSPSTFKPPPRVTLTDTKREMWLKDLANPAISLRKLSRTIPHGIRGKVLLEHCLNKNVPTERAVWLAKCVGANDLRAFRRKGVSQTFMGGETKWIRDWTLYVEQFVENVSSSFDMPDWKSKVIYAIRLATNLYAEQLLDRDHYTEWLLAGVENSPQSKLPMWVLIMQLYWKDLLRLRKAGRRLVASLLNHLHAIQKDPDRDLLMHLSTRLTTLLTSLMATNPESFISPATWSKRRDALGETIRHADADLHASYQAIDSRNDWLVTGNTGSFTQSMHERLVKLLDPTLYQPFDASLISQCWTLGSDKDSIVRTLLDWGTSSLRPGLTKIYVVIRLLRAWGKLGLDVTAALLDYLDLVPTDEHESKRLLYHIISDLTRSGDFFPSRYIQWLISRGGPADPTEIEPTGPCSTRLLVELPTHILTPPLLCMRTNLLRRASFDIAAEKLDLENAVKLVRHGMGLPLSPGDPVSLKKPMSATKLAKPISKSGRALQASIGAFLKEDVFGDLVFGGGGPGISCDALNFARTILEAAGDYEMLLGVLKVAFKVSNPEVLASCADTISLHLTAFAAMEDVGQLFDMLLGFLRNISQEQGIVSARSFLASLAGLAERIPGQAERSQQLRNELLQCDRSSAIDACSPVSDSMVGHHPDIEGTIHEEMDKVLSSGTRVDHPTMDRLFNAITSHVEACWMRSAEAQRAYAALMTRLRAFDTHHFDGKMEEWICQIRTAPSRPAFLETLPLFVGQGCLSLSTVLKACKLNPQASVSGQPSLQPSGKPYLQEILQLASMCPPQSAVLTAEDCCRFRVQQEMLFCGHPSGLRELLRSALAEYCEWGGELGVSQLPLDRPGCWMAVLDLFKRLVILDPRLLAESLTQRAPSQRLSGLVETLATQALGLGDGPGSQVTFDRVLEMASELSLPFCQVKLSLSLTGNGNMPSNHQAESHLSLFTQAMERAIAAHNVMWTSLLPHLSDSIAQHIKSEAQNQFLNLIPSTKTPLNAGPSLEESLQAANSLLSVIESISRGHAAPKATPLTPSMSEKLSDLWDILSAGDEDKTPLRSAVLTSWLPLMLRFIAMHVGPSVEQPAASTPGNTSIRPPPNPAQTELRAKVLLTLAGILQELDTRHPSEAKLIQANRLSQKVFDVALVLVDGLPDDARAHCCRAVFSPPPQPPDPAAPNTAATQQQSAAASDPRLRYLLSYTPPPAENLMLAPRSRMAGQGGSMRTAMLGAPGQVEKLTPFSYRRWEVLNEPTPNVGENDTSLSLTLFDAIKLR